MKTKSLTFKQAKELIMEDLENVYEDCPEENDWQEAIKEIKKTKDMDELFSALGSIGFDQNDAIDFVLRCLVDQ